MKIFQKGFVDGFSLLWGIGIVVWTIAGLQVINWVREDVVRCENYNLEYKFFEEACQEKQK